MPFLIVEALQVIVPVKYSHVRVLCQSGAQSGMPLATSSIDSRLTTRES